MGKKNQIQDIRNSEFSDEETGDDLNVVKIIQTKGADDLLR
jgi:hypothetical protein